MTHYRIVKWETYQHYTNRRPPWVKFYTTFNEDSQRYSTPTRLVLALFLCVAAKKDNHIPADVRWLSVEMGLPEKEITAAVKVLLRDDFIAVYSEQTSVLDDTDASESASKVASDSAMPTRVSSSSSSSLTNQPAKPKTDDAREIRRKEVWDALVATCGDVTNGNRKLRAQIVNDLVADGATGADVYERHPLLERRWPDLTITDTALRKHWGIALKPIPSAAKSRGETLGADIQAQRERLQERLSLNGHAEVLELTASEEE